jgi:hypothetical protein
MRWRELVPAVVFGVALGGLANARGASASVKMCDANICHTSTGNCQVTEIPWNCDETVGGGCEDCECGASETCPG